MKTKSSIFKTLPNDDLTFIHPWIELPYKKFSSLSKQELTFYLLNWPTNSIPGHETELMLNEHSILYLLKAIERCFYFWRHQAPVMKPNSNEFLFFSSPKGKWNMFLLWIHQAPVMKPKWIEFLFFSSPAVQPIHLSVRTTTSMEISAFQPFQDGSIQRKTCNL